MSDNFYAVELMAREKARWAETEMQRRQMLVRAQAPNPPVSCVFFRRFLSGVLIRVGRFLLRRWRVVQG